MLTDETFSDPKLRRLRAGCSVSWPLASPSKNTPWGDRWLSGLQADKN